MIKWRKVTLADYMPIYEGVDAASGDKFTIKWSGRYARRRVVMLNGEYQRGTYTTLKSAKRACEKKFFVDNANTDCRKDDRIVRGSPSGW